MANIHGQTKYKDGKLLCLPAVIFCNNKTQLCQALVVDDGKIVKIKKMNQVLVKLLI